MPATMSLLGLYNWDSGLFDTVRLPSSVDKARLIHNLLKDCGEFEVVYPQPEIFKIFAASWSEERFPIWRRLEDTMHYDYDPISNYNRKEEWEDVTSGESNGSSENQTAGYNSAAADVPEGRSSAQSSGSSKAIRKGRAYGNIGVTTTQQMIQQERDISMFDMEQLIIDEFKKNFCILIY